LRYGGRVVVLSARLACGPPDTLDQHRGRLNNEASTAASSSPPSDGLYGAQRLWAILAILLGTFLGNLDAAIANIALPVISRDLGSSASTAVWVVNAYQLIMAITVLPLAVLGDRLGYRRVYLTGLVVFTLGSAACTMSSSIGTLVGARAFQGLGGACMAAMGPALLRSVFPQKIVGRGIALLGFTVAIATSIGPSAAAAILRIADWPWLFGINVPIGLALIVAASSAVPGKVGVARPFDVTGAILTGAALTLLILGVDGLAQGRHAGDGSASPDASGYKAIVELAVAALLIAILVVHQKRHATPLVPVDLLRIPIFSLSMLTSVCSYSAQTLAMVSLPFLLEHHLGRDTTTAGLLITPWPLVIIFVAPLAGWLSDRYPAGVLGSIGLAILAAGLALTALLPADPTNFDIAWRIALCGIGFGFYQTPNNRIILSAGPRERSGVASGMMATSRIVGMTLGAAIAALLFDVGGERGTTFALTAGALFAATGIVLSCLRLFARPI
jgi:DHA2 family multidrug resistance protein-like MFS transporter